MDGAAFKISFFFSSGDVVAKKEVPVAGEAPSYILPRPDSALLSSFSDFPADAANPTIEALAFFSSGFPSDPSYEPIVDACLFPSES